MIVVCDLLWCDVLGGSALWLHEVRCGVLCCHVLWCGVLCNVPLSCALVWCHVVWCHVPKGLLPEGNGKDVYPRAKVEEGLCV